MCFGLQTFFWCSTLPEDHGVCTILSGMHQTQSAAHRQGLPRCQSHYWCGDDLTTPACTMPAPLPSAEAVEPPDLAWPDQVQLQWPHVWQVAWRRATHSFLQLFSLTNHHILLSHMRSCGTRATSPSWQGIEVEGSCSKFTTPAITLFFK